MRYFWRFLKNNPLYAVINMVGLALSLMFVILIGDYTYRQFSIDRWHRNHDRIYLLATDDDAMSWPDLTRSLPSHFPEIESVCCLNMHQARIKSGDVYSGDVNWSGDSDGEGQGNLMIADSTFFDFFDFKLLEGDRETALNAPEKCVITESLAGKLFPGRNPLGQPLNIVGARYVTITDDLGDPYDSTLVYTVSGVVADLDRTALLNSTEIIASSGRVSQLLGYRPTNYVLASGPFGSTLSFLMLSRGASPDGKADELTRFSKDNCPAFSFWGDRNAALIPLNDLMFAPQNEGAGIQTGDRSLLGILLAVVLAILLFAVTNYINLTVANTGFRAKEMALRRLLGSDGTKISLELIVESTVMVSVAFLVGFALSLLCQDSFAALFKGKIAILRDINPATLSVSLLFIVLTGVISGILPTVALSRFKPIDVVKGSFRYHSKMVLSRVFIILQNVITATMLTATLTIWLQMNHLINAPLGYNTEDIYVVSPDNSSRMRDALAQQPFVRGIGLFSGSALDGNGLTMRNLKDKDMNNILVNMMTCDRNFMEISGLRILEDYHVSGDVFYYVEKTAAKMGVSSENREIVWGDGTVTQVGGIIADFHSINVLDPYRDFEIRIEDSDAIEDPCFLVRTDGSRDALQRLRSLAAEVDGNSDDLEWKVRSIGEEVRMSFSDERNTLRLVGLFTAVAVLISVLGFIGMSLFFVRQRRREVGVRRIMGSSSREILALLLRKFCAPLLLSFVVSVPLSLWLMNRWLENFSYRIQLSAWIFVAASAGSLLIALVSVFFQTLRASHENPAEAVRTE